MSLAVTQGPFRVAYRLLHCTNCGSAYEKRGRDAQGFSVLLHSALENPVADIRPPDERSRLRPRLCENFGFEIQHALSREIYKKCAIEPALMNDRAAFLGSFRSILTRSIVFTHPGP